MFFRYLRNLEHSNPFLRIFVFIVTIIINILVIIRVCFRLFRTHSLSQDNSRNSDGPIIQFSGYFKPTEPLFNIPFIKLFLGLCAILNLFVCLLQENSYILILHVTFWQLPLMYKYCPRTLYSHVVT